MVLKRYQQNWRKEWRNAQHLSHHSFRNWQLNHGQNSQKNHPALHPNLSIILKNPHDIKQPKIKSVINNQRPFTSKAHHLKSILKQVDLARAHLCLVWRRKGHLIICHRCEDRVNLQNPQQKHPPLKRDPPQQIR